MLDTNHSFIMIRIKIKAMIWCKAVLSILLCLQVILCMCTDVHKEKVSIRPTELTKNKNLRHTRVPFTFILTWPLIYKLQSYKNTNLRHARVSFTFFLHDHQFTNYNHTIINIWDIRECHLHFFWHDIERQFRHNGLLKRRYKLL